MLTKSEKKWCKRRQKINNSPLQEPWVLAPEFVRMAFNEMHEAREAADFEGRVTAKLAKVISNLVKEEPWPDIEVQATTPDLVLKWVRLSVEEEMDENS